MIVGAITVLVMLVFSTFAFTTKESREASRRRMARWDPYFAAIAVIALAILVFG